MSENLQSKIDNITQNANAVISHQSEKYQDAYLDAYGVFDQMLLGFWERLPYICVACVVILLFWLISKIFKYSLEKALENHTPQRRNLIIVLARVGHIAILFIGILVALMIVVPSFTPAQAISGLGIGSVAIGFAFKDIFQNFLSGILILLSEPFKVGDSIKVNSMEGTVEDIQIRATFLRSSDGRRLIIPNATVYTSAIVVNTAFQQRRCEFSVNIADTENIEQAKNTILHILEQNEFVLKEPSYSVFVNAISDASVSMTVRWWIDTTQIGTTQASSEIQALVKANLLKTKEKTELR